MSYQVLARKWRPSIFSEVVGQEHVLKALINALDSGRLHHAYLFAGTRGVGKTTLARIFAKSLNCEKGVSSTPCQQCTACRQISEGRFVDLIEVDAASRTGIDDTRELLDNVQYAPTSGRYKVYLIDEVHMLSNSSFNALLKTLEEPPEHVKFLLATTDPQKLPVTVLSRCLQFNLKNLSTERIMGHLQHILSAEGIAAEESALWQIARSAQGSMRDALSLTDQAIAHGSGRLSESEVSAMLGTIDRRHVYDLLESVIAQDGQRLLTILADLSVFSPDYAAVLEELLSVLHRIAIAQAVPDALDDALGDRAHIIDMASRIAPEETQVLFQLVLLGRKELTHNPSLCVGFEMILLRLLAFAPSGGISERTVSSSRTPDRSLSVATTTEGLPAKKPDSVVTAVAAAADSPAISSMSVQPEDQSFEPKVDLPVSETYPQAATRADSPFVELDEVPPWMSQEISQENSLDDPPVEIPAQPASKSPMVEALTPDAWVTCFEGLEISGSLRSAASHMVLERVENEICYFLLGEEGQGIFSQSHQVGLADALSTYFQRPIQIKVIEQNHRMSRATETPAEQALRLQRERRDQARSALLNDPAVQTLLAEFDARLDENSVRFLDGTDSTP